MARKQLCNEDRSEKRACHDLSKINCTAEFMSGRMRIIPYVSLAILFFSTSLQCIKCIEGLKIGIFPLVNVQIIH